MGSDQPNFSQKQNLIRENIRSKTSAIQNFDSYDELDNIIKSSFTEEEKKFLDADERLKIYYENELNNIWEVIQGNRKKSIEDKLIQLSRDQTFSSIEMN